MTSYLTCSNPVASYAYKLGTTYTVLQLIILELTVVYLVSPRTGTIRCMSSIVNISAQPTPQSREAKVAVPETTPADADTGTSLKYHQAENVPSTNRASNLLSMGLEIKCKVSMFLQYSVSSQSLIIFRLNSTYMMLEITLCLRLALDCPVTFENKLEPTGFEPSERGWDSQAFCSATRCRTPYL